MTSTTDQKSVSDVLTFWFGKLDKNGFATPEASQRWSIKDPAFDDEIRENYEALYQDIVAGKKEDWLKTSDGLVAYVVVIDQLSRNMYRDTAKMYASDEQALTVALKAIDEGRDKNAIFAHRNFLYMPLMHAEDVALQDQCVALYSEWSTEVEGELKADVEKRIGFAIRHRDIVARFGRFPHRNTIVGRPSTAEELEFLTQPGSSF